MKKFLPLAIAFLTGGVIQAQNIVTTIPQHKSAVLEEFTGIYCTWCPEGHRIAKDFKNANPGRVVLVNVHTGGYASPQGGDPDYRTGYGTALANQSGVTGYPTGSVNRKIFPDISSSMAMSRGAWPLAGEKILNSPSPVNLGATTSYDAATRTVTINVEAFYTEDASNSNYNLLNIALIEDSIPGPQTGASKNPQDVLPNGQYLHAHMLRDFVTGQWGDTIPNTSKSSLFTKTYTYSIPTDVNGVGIDPDNSHLAIYITETRTDITQGITVDVKNGSNDGNNSPIYGHISNLGTHIKDGAASTPTSFNFDFASTLSGTQDFDFTLEVVDAPSDWSANYKVNGTSYTGTNTINLSGGSAANVELEITPGATAALAHYKLRAYPAFDSSSVVEQDFYLISGVTDLIVNGSGAFGDGNSYNWEQVYTSALNNAGSNSFDLANANVMVEAFNNSAFTEVRNVYFNIGWTFPSFSDDQVSALMNFMDNDGNVFVAGQDIGWDINDPSGYGTPLSRAFYTGYLNANYQSDGNAQNNQLTADTADAVFGNVASSAIVDKYGGNMYPDVIFPRSTAKSIFYYNNLVSKSAGIRYADNYKVVYLGVGLEMIQDAGVKNEIMSLTYDWFHGIISTDEFDFASRGVSVYPNPAKGLFKFELPVKGDYTYKVYNASGSLVKQGEFNSSEVTGEVDLTNMPEGVYLMKLQFGSKSMSKKLVVE